MPKYRPVHAALVIALAASVLPFTPSAQGAQGQNTTSNDSRRDPGLLGTEVRGSGKLQNFTAEGANLIRLQVGAFDPVAGDLPTPAGIALVDEATLPAGTAQYWLVQVRNKQFPQAAAAVNAAGGLIAGYVHDDTYMVRATPAQRTQIAASSAVRWSGYYQPAWRVPVAAAGRPGLLELKGTQTYSVYIFAVEPTPGSVRRALAGMQGVQVVGDGGVVVDVRATAAQVPAMAALPAVEFIGIKPKAVPLNSNARWVNDTGIRDVYSATAPGRLTGAGQTAAVADTGLNYTYDLNRRAHVAFRDCNAQGACKEAIFTQETPGNSAAAVNAVKNNKTNHRKMVAYFDIANSGPHPFDPSSHGSHTGGSVDGDQPPYDKYTRDDGLAPAAEHVHQNIGTASGGLSIPGDLYDLFRQAYRPRKPSDVAETSGANGNPEDYKPYSEGGKYRPRQDARTHNNSWGLVAPLVDDGRAARMDKFVWDHEDMVISFSAGNMGPDAFSIGSPSTGKNELSSGASANGRQPMVSIDSMASFSSHGPTPDGRYGPDLATPGQIVVSVKGGTTDGYHVAQGTSMSSPVLTGLATLVRQYFFDGYAKAGGDGFAAGRPGTSRSHNPSAALVKAALINGAARMRGFYTGDDGTQRALDGQWPSAGQGFGRVNLANSLYFAGDRSNNWYVDVYRGDTEGPENTRSFPASSAPQVRTFQLDVRRGQALDVSLAWTDAPDLLPAGSPALVNNLDLVVTGPGTGANAETYVGNNMNSRLNPQVANAETIPGDGNRDVRNLSERVRLSNPTPGTYTVAVEAPEPIAVGRQGFALAASGNLAPVKGSFSPGPRLQEDEPGSPRISKVTVKPISADTAELRFRTSEPTTATANTSPAIPGETFVDSYNEGFDGFSGDLGEGPVETSAEYADKPVITNKHEMLLTGFTAGQTYTIQVRVKDLGRNFATRNARLNAPATVFQARSDDTGQCFEGEPNCEWDSDPAATQLYAGNIPSTTDPLGRALGAFMFRTPEGFDPNDITMATVEMVSAHDWVIPYREDPILYVDQLNQSIEPSWGSQTQDYNAIKATPADARLLPQTTHKRGAYQRYAFTYACSDLAKLKESLANRQVAFRWDSSNGGFFSMDFGFNRRSGGPDLRPKLVLYTNQTGNNPTGEPCDPATPAPKISKVGIHEGLADNSMTVSWETDVDSDSVVFFREQGTTAWTQVATPARTRVHHVQVLGLDRTKDYEFVVRSAACNGATTTDTNQGEGYDFFRPPPPPLDTYYFHGTAPSDDPEKAAGPPFPPGSLTFNKTAPNESTDTTQTGTPFAHEDYPANELAYFWYGDFSGTIDADVQLDWFWSTTNAEAIALGADMEVTFFADPNLAVDRDLQPEKVIGRGVVVPDVGPTPVRTVNTVPVKGTVENTLLIQVVPFFVDSGQGNIVHYDSTAHPSKFGIPEGRATEEALPVTGPVPPPSAGATGITAPQLRGGPATAADRAAGTGVCAVAESDLAISKSDRPDPVCAGDTLTYRVRVANRGPATASGVRVTETLPPGTVFLSAKPSQGSCTGTTCNLGTLEEGASATVIYRVRPSRRGTMTNTASVSSASAESQERNNSASATTTVRPDKPDLKPVRITLENHPRVGKESRLATKVENNGCATARNVLVEFRDEQGRQIDGDQTIEKIAAGDYRHATVPWTPRSTGRQTITVIVDPNDSIDEIRENNNTFSRTYRVRRA